MSVRWLIAIYHGSLRFEFIMQKSYKFVFSYFKYGFLLKIFRTLPKGKKRFIREDKFCFQERNITFYHQLWEIQAFSVFQSN